MVGYDFYPTGCVFSIPKPWRGDKKYTTSWIKIISNHKPWEIRFITCYNTISIFTYLLCSLLDAKVPNVISTVLRYNHVTPSQCHRKKSYGWYPPDIKAYYYHLLGYGRETSLFKLFEITRRVCSGKENNFKSRQRILYIWLLSSLWMKRCFPPNWRQLNPLTLRF